MMMRILEKEASDIELLRRFVEDRREEAFRGLVERHANMVFSVALRRSGQWEIAEEAAQNVFRTLAEKASKLSADVVLAGWLHKAAIFEAATLQRAESTRTRKMNEAADSLAGEKDSDAAFDPEDWAELTPFIDTAIDQLPAGDRDIVLLRFYQGLTYREIGQRLGKNESAARKHTLRALDALGSLLKSRGISLPSAAIGAGIAYGIGGAAPPSFGSSLAASIALPAAPAVASHSFAIVAVAVMIFGGVPFAFQWQRSSRPTPTIDPVAENRSAPLTALTPKRSANHSGAAETFDLDSVFEVNGSERLRRLALWLPGATPDDLRAAAERLMIDQRAPSANMNISNHNLDMAWSAIFARWVELDPQALVAYAKDAPHPRYSFMKYPQLVQFAFSAWADADPAAAMAAAEQEPPQVRIAVIRQLAQRDPGAAIEAAAGLPIVQARRQLDFSGMFKSLAQSDLASAAERARSVKDGKLQLKAVSGVLSVWAETDPEAALEYAASLENFEARAAGRDVVLAGLVARDPMGALPLITDLPNGNSRAMLMRSVAQKMASSDAEAASVWAETLTSPQDRHAAFAGLAIGFSKSDPDAALAALTELNWDLRDPGTASDYNPGGYGPSRAFTAQPLGGVAITLITNLAKTDPQLALRYAFSFEGSLYSTPFGDIARRYVEGDPGGAMAFAAGLESGPLRNDLAVQVATFLGVEDPAGAMLWASQLDGRAGERAQTSVFTTIASKDPQAAALTLGDLPETPEREKAVRFLAESWLGRDFEAASGWIQQHPDIESISPAVRVYIEHWTERDPREASEWAASLPDGVARQHAAVGLVGWMINQPDLDHQVAFAWAQRITDFEDERHFCFEHITRDWLQHDPLAARAALATTDLPDDLKQRLLSRHGSDAQTGN